MILNIINFANMAWKENDEVSWNVRRVLSPRNPCAHKTPTETDLNVYVTFFFLSCDPTNSKLMQCDSGSQASWKNPQHRTGTPWGSEERRHGRPQSPVTQGVE